MIKDLHIVLDQDEVDHHFHVSHILESIKANDIVLLVLMNQEVINAGIDDNVLVKMLFLKVEILTSLFC